MDDIDYINRINKLRDLERIQLAQAHLEDKLIIDEIRRGGLEVDDFNDIRTNIKNKLVLNTLLSSLSKQNSFSLNESILRSLRGAKGFDGSFLQKFYDDSDSDILRGEAAITIGKCLPIGINDWIMKTIKNEGGAARLHMCLALIGKNDPKELNQLFIDVFFEYPGILAKCISETGGINEVNFLLKIKSDNKMSRDELREINRAIEKIYKRLKIKSSVS